MLPLLFTILVSIISTSATPSLPPDHFPTSVAHTWGLRALPMDDARAIVHLYFGSLAGDVPSQMALGYRHSRGDGVPFSCKTAAVYYELAANSAVDEMNDKTGGVEPLAHAERIPAPDEGKPEGKVYTDVDIVEYYHNLASKGDPSSLAMLGRFYYFGARGVERDLSKALYYFNAGAGKNDFASMVGLGHVLLSKEFQAGLATPEERAIHVAWAWGNFTAATENNFPAGFNGLGVMLMRGYPGLVDRDVEKSIKYFSKAADASVAEGFYNLGAVYASSLRPTSRDFIKSFRYFSLAAQKGSLLAMHKLAHMSLHGIGTLKSCKNAVTYFKAVAERARFCTHTNKQFAKAFAERDTVDLQETFERYAQLAEMGYEAAETNAARILDEIASKNYTEEIASSLVGKLQMGLDALGISHAPSSGTADALRLYERAAEQGNQRARVRVGDFFFYGYGDLGEPDYAEAAAQYRLASEGHDAQANFNLGYQHQHGLGLSRDLHLARRYYELAQEVSPDAKVPVALALTGLWIDAARHALLLGDWSVSSWSGGYFAGTSGSGSDQVATIGKDAMEDIDSVSSWSDWISSDAFSLSYDTVAIIILVWVFFGINKLREYRRQVRARRLEQEAIQARAREVAMVVEQG